MNPNTKNVLHFLGTHNDKLAELRSMWSDPRVQCYDDQEMPSAEELATVDSVFLAGPTSRNQIPQYNWRSAAVMMLRVLGFSGWIYVPEPRGKGEHGDFTDKEKVYTWESSRLLSATHVMFSIPRCGTELLGLNTNLELGIYLGKAMSDALGKQKLFIGWPESAERMGLPKHYAELARQEIFSPDLATLCQAVAQTPRA